MYNKSVFLKERYKMISDISAQVLFQDTHVPDIFIKEYLPMLDGESVKVYIYCLFIAGKNNGFCYQDDLRRVFGYDDIKMRNCFNRLSNLGLISVKTKKVYICDIKEKELNKYYAPKSTLDVKESSRVVSPSVRNGVIKRISDVFFAGQMPPSWYGEIDTWYEKFDFDDDVMYMLFQHCSDQLMKNRQSLNKAYVGTVAKNWFNLNIKTSNDLENYLLTYEKYRGIRSDVMKKLRYSGNLTEYEEKVIEKWFFQFKFTFDVIELSLKKSVSSRNATLATYDRFLTEWHTNNLSTVEQINEYEENKRKKYIERNQAATNNKTNVVPQSNYKDQRMYDDDFFKSLDEKI